MTAEFMAVLRRESLLAWRSGLDMLTAVLFFLMIPMLVAFGVGPDAGLLAKMAGGLVWVAALLAVLLGLDRLYQADFEDGTLEQMVVSCPSLTLLCLAKSCAHFITSGIPLLLATPLAAMMMSLPVSALPVLLASLCLGIPSLCLTGGLGSLLILGARRGHVLLALLIMPLYIPPLILGAGAVNAAMVGAPVRGWILLQLALTIVTLCTIPFASAASLKQAVE